MSEEQYARVRKNGTYIMNVKLPNWEMQFLAVDNDPDAIKYIDYPFEEVQISAVKQDGYLIQYIINKKIKPSENVQLAAVKQNGLAIRFLSHPPETVQLAAVKQNGDAIRYIANPGCEVQISAVKQNPASSRLISNPHPNLYKAFIIPRKLEKNTECLVSRNVIKTGMEYKVCSVKCDHIILYDVWKQMVQTDSKWKNICAYCKGGIDEKDYVNLEK